MAITSMTTITEKLRDSMLNIKYFINPRDLTNVYMFHDMIWLSNSDTISIQFRSTCGKYYYDVHYTGIFLVNHKHEDIVKDLCRHNTLLDKPLFKLITDDAYTR